MNLAFDDEDLIFLAHEIVSIPSVSCHEGPASARLVQRLEARGFDAHVDDAGNAVLGHVEHNELAATRPIPWELRIGATYFPVPRALITVDVGIHGGAGRANAPVRLVDDGTMPASRFLVMAAHSRPSIRAALGGEVMLRKRLPIRGGVLAYRSGAPDVPALADAVSASDMHTVGGSLSVGFVLSGGHELSFGAACVHAWGTGAGLDQGNPARVRYVARDALETRVLLGIAGGRRAAKHFAKKLVKKSEKWIR